MRILFGVQGTGNGHVSRCRTLAKALASHGAQVDYILSGREPDKYFDVDAFGQYRCYKGMTFVTENGKISIPKTLKKLHAIQLIKDIRQLDTSCYDVIISDFEPVTAWAAKLQGKSVLGISNQAIFSYMPPKELDCVGKMVMKYYAPVNTLIGLHWYHFGYPILPPIIDKIEHAEENREIVIYLPFEKLDKIESLFVNYPEYSFLCFHPDVKEVRILKNIELNPLSRDGFVASLRTCSGIVTNAGFALISEALSLGKKILVKPLKGQFEQTYNARCLQHLGLAATMKKFEPDVIAQWLKQPSTSPVIYPDVADALAQWIINGQKEDIAELSKRLWQQVEFPEQVSNKLQKLELNQLNFD